MRHKKRIAEIMTEFVVEMGKLRDAQERVHALKAELKRLVDPGDYSGFVIYKVSSHHVPGYDRSGYTAMRGRRYYRAT